MTRPFSPSPASPAAADVDFDRVARWYDGAARLVFGAAQRNAQRAALAGLPSGAPRVLILGGGSGWVLEEVWRRRPAATVLYIDASAAMLRQARARLQQLGPARQGLVEFRLGTEAALAADDTFDAVLTFFVFDCMTPPTLQAAVARLARALRPGGRWLVAEFTQPRQWWQRALQRGMYLFFNWTARLAAQHLPDYETALAKLGWQPQQAGYFFGGAIQGAVFVAREQAAAKK